MKTELQSKHNQKKKIKNELCSVNITLKSKLRIIVYNCLIHQFNIASEIKLKAITKSHLRKLDQFRRRTSTPINEKVTFSYIKTPYTIFRIILYPMKNTRLCGLGWVIIFLISLLITPQKQSLRCFTKAVCQTVCQTFEMFAINITT